MKADTTVDRAIVFPELLKRCALALALALLVQGGLAQDAIRYQRAPELIRQILDAPVTPTVSLSPTRDRLLLVETVQYPPLRELAEPMLALGGYRINPRNNGPHRAPNHVGLTLKAIPDGAEKRIRLPENSRVSLPVWSSDGKRFAFARYARDTVELWVGETARGTARRHRGVALNAGFGTALEWMPDNVTLLCRTVPAGRGQPPASAEAPASPVIQESRGQSSRVRTHQDLLQNPADEAQFDYYATAQLVLVNTRNGRVTRVGTPAIFSAVDPAPDGQHLLVTRIVRPYSYLLPAARFPKEVEIWDRTGRLVCALARLVQEDEYPPGGVQPGPRRHHWRPTSPATVVWIEALDGGDPRKKMAHRDRVLLLEAPFTGTPRELARAARRFSALSWSEDPGVALLRDYQSSRRWSRTWLINPNNPAHPHRLVWERSTQDRYGDPGTPLTKRLPTGHSALRVHDGCLFLSGTGASPAGERPFLDRLNLQTLQTERLFQSDGESYESLVALVTDDGARFITRRETSSEPPNYFLRGKEAESRIALTRFADPAPLLRTLTRQQVTYAREDGVALSFTLVRPPGHPPGERLPTLLWAYPREYTDADIAGQVTGSTNRFIQLTGASQLFFALHGYAVLDGATMPVVGAVKKANDTYLDQIVASARAAIAKAVELGVTDPGRVGVAGHSYGAFMTANLLAHSDLFRAGIARSGAYNRTLTPFGFQSETRTLWQAPDMYLKNSPFLAANKINEPILLIHGEADNNSGTFPMQSERLYQAVRGNGGIARLVMLPFESHAYQARESVEHVLWEMLAWFDEHVKNAPPRSDPPVDPGKADGDDADEVDDGAREANGGPSETAVETVRP